LFEIIPNELAAHHKNYFVNWVFQFFASQLQEVPEDERL
jgi:hypothetical protein